MYGTYEFEIHLVVLENMSILNSKKSTRRNKSCKSIVSLHIRHLISGVRDLRIWYSPGRIGKYVVFEIYLVVLENMSIFNSKTKTPEKISPSTASYPCIFPTSCAVYRTYEFEIHLVLLENMCILNSKIQTPEKIIHPTTCILGYSPPRVGCTRLTNLKFTYS